MSEFDKDLANVMGSFIKTELDYIENSNNELEQLQQENQQLKTNFMKLQQQSDLYKSIIDEVQNYMITCIKDVIKGDSYGDLKTIKMFYDYPLEILDRSSNKDNVWRKNHESN